MHRGNAGEGLAAGATKASNPGSLRRPSPSDETLTAQVYEALQGGKVQQAEALFGRLDDELRRQDAAQASKLTKAEDAAAVAALPDLDDVESSDEESPRQARRAPALSGHSKNN
eukprot:TRINITY_DN90842_c0_g1_i1.p1 TRINITY_DN90842_c0_g1~~TRINITY_DN90842_c0_g1_i1.p1  ORF type:complete len:114 (-),score=35.95 TRINITY_DN90842_c0_g1_i1:37-378(-)